MPQPDRTIPRVCLQAFRKPFGCGAAIAVWALALACKSDGTTSTPDVASISLEVTPPQLNVVQYQGGIDTSAAITVIWHNAAEGDVDIRVEPGFPGANSFLSGVAYRVSPTVLTPSSPATAIQIHVRTSNILLGNYPFVIIASGAGVEPDTSQLLLNVVAPGPPVQFRMYPVDNSSVLTNSTLSVYAYVLDSEGNVILGEVVEWAVESGGGSLDRVVSTTGFGTDTVAAVNTWVLGDGEGEQALQLRVRGSSITHRYVVRASSDSS